MLSSRGSPPPIFGGPDARGSAPLSFFQRALPFAGLCPCSPPIKMALGPLLNAEQTSVVALQAFPGEPTLLRPAAFSCRKMGYLTPRLGQVGALAREMPVLHGDQIRTLAPSTTEWRLLTRDNLHALCRNHSRAAESKGLA
jgi:hypothetical protein